jgi:hypothetical protein
MTIPPFNELGYLPPGIYETSWLEFMKRFATNRHRQRLVTGLAAALRKLANAGCRRVLIGGSFVTSKEHPNDFDGWYESFGLDLDILDPLFLEGVESQMEVFGGTLFDPPSYEGFYELPRLATLSRSFRQSLTNRVSNASSGQLTNTKDLMTIAVFHRRLTTLVPNAVSQIVNLAQKVSEGYSQVQRYTLVQNLLDSDTGTSCVDRGIQLLSRHYCTTDQIGIYSTKRLLLLIVARYTNHSILASVVDGRWRFLIHLPRHLPP